MYVSMAWPRVTAEGDGDPGAAYFL
jgi:hypothetical protein